VASTDLWHQRLLLPVGGAADLCAGRLGGAVRHHRAGHPDFLAARGRNRTRADRPGGAWPVPGPAGRGDGGSLRPQEGDDRLRPGQGGGVHGPPLCAHRSRTGCRFASVGGVHHVVVARQGGGCPQPGAPQEADRRQLAQPGCRLLHDAGRRWSDLPVDRSQRFIGQHFVVGAAPVSEFVEPVAGAGVLLQRCIVRDRGADHLEIGAYSQACAWRQCGGRRAGGGHRTNVLRHA